MFLGGWVREGKRDEGKGAEGVSEREGDRESSGWAKERDEWSSGEMLWWVKTPRAAVLAHRAQRPHGLSPSSQSRSLNPHSSARWQSIHYKPALMAPCCILMNWKQKSSIWMNRATKYEAVSWGDQLPQIRNGSSWDVITGSAGLMTVSDGCWGLGLRQSSDGNSTLGQSCLVLKAVGYKQCRVGMCLTWRMLCSRLRRVVWWVCFFSVLSGRSDQADELSKTSLSESRVKHGLIASVATSKGSEWFFVGLGDLA